MPGFLRFSIGASSHGGTDPALRGTGAGPDSGAERSARAARPAARSKQINDGNTRAEARSGRGGARRSTRTRCSSRRSPPTIRRFQDDGAEQVRRRYPRAIPSLGTQGQELPQRQDARHEGHPRKRSKPRKTSSRQRARRGFTATATMLWK